jgi:hypothetical protein
MNLNPEPISDSFWSIGPYCLGISVTLMVASPMLWCGLLGDDILNANTPDYIQTTYGSLANMIASISEAWSTTKGRLYPVAFALCYTIWNYLYADPLYTKVLSLICFGLSLASCGHFLFRFTRNNCLAFLTLLLMSIEVQLRAWSYDPLLAFPVLVPFVISVIFLQATFLHHYLVTSSRLALATSMLLLSIGLLTYELSFVALPVSFVIVLTTRSERARKLRSAISLFAIPCLYLYVRWKLRAVDAGDYGGVALSFDARQSLHALGVNLFSAIPLSYIIADPRSIFGSAFYVNSTKLFPVLAAISGGFFWIWCRFAVCDQRLARTANNGGAALVGLVLILVPAAMLSVSERYQNEVTLYGYVYLQVLVEEFGMAIVGAVGVCNLIGQFGKRNTVLFGLLLAPLPSLVYAANVAVVTTLNRDVDQTGRAGMISAMKVGIFNDVPEGSLLVFDTPPVWVNSAFIHMYSGKKMEIAASEAVSNIPHSDAFLVVIKRDNPRHWFIRDGRSEVSLQRLPTK